MNLSTPSLIHLAVTLGIFGLIFWLVDTYIPMADPFKTIVRVVMVVILIVVLLRFFGLY